MSDEGGQMEPDRAAVIGGAAPFVLWRWMGGVCGLCALTAASRPLARGRAGDGLADLAWSAAGQCMSHGGWRGVSPHLLSAAGAALTPHIVVLFLRTAVGCLLSLAWLIRFSRWVCVFCASTRQDSTNWFFMQRLQMTLALPGLVSLGWLASRR